MNKAELVSALAERTGLKKTESERAIKGLVEIVEETLKEGERVQIVGFGSFEAPMRKPREGKNPKTGKVMTVTELRSPKFRAGRAFKEAVNKK